jgi:hypothetical protein
MCATIEFKITSSNEFMISPNKLMHATIQTEREREREREREQYSTIMWASFRLMSEITELLRSLNAELMILFI